MNEPGRDGCGGKTDISHDWHLAGNRSMCRACVHTQWAVFLAMLEAAIDEEH